MTRRRCSRRITSLARGVPGEPAGCPLYDRFFNLIDRSYVARSGLTYEITDAGLAYLDQYAPLLPGRTVSSKQPDLHRLAAELSRESREQLAEDSVAAEPDQHPKSQRFPTLTHL
jgi:hypothetical protein